jgi:hypothetical protein
MGLDTLTNIKSRLNITGSSYDTFLQAQIDLISDTIEAYCRRVFTEADYVQTFYRDDYCACRLLELYHFPVTSDGSDIVITEDGQVLDTEGFRLHKPSGRITRTDGGLFFLSEETEVEYSAGFTTIPSPILGVLDSLVLERYNKQSSGVGLNFGSDVQRISIPGSISIDFDYTLNNNDRKSAFGVVLGNNLNVLDSYRSERAILGASHLVYVDEVTP